MRAWGTEWSIWYTLKYRRYLAVWTPCGKDALNEESARAPHRQGGWERAAYTIPSPEKMGMADGRGLCPTFPHHRMATGGRGKRYHPLPQLQKDNYVT